MSNKEYDRAVPALIRCAAADPMSALPYWRIGQIEVLKGNFTSAEMWLMEASTKFSATLMIKDEEIFHDIGVAVFQNKKIDRAQFYLGLALEINQRFPKGLNNYGCLMASTGRMDESVGYLKRAVELNSTNYLYISNLVFMSSYVGDHKTANWASEIFARTYPDVKEVKRDCVWEFVPAS
jgi:Flp pilus assembly protein TadD